MCCLPFDLTFPVEKLRIPGTEDRPIEYGKSVLLPSDRRNAYLFLCASNLQLETKQDRPKRQRTDVDISKGWEAPPTTPDLFARIPPSDVVVPALYKDFLLSKEAVLFSFVARQSGPALRDAVAVTHLIPSIITTTNMSPEDYTQACKSLLQSYVEPPHSIRGLAAMIGPSLEVTITLLRFNRTVQRAGSSITEGHLLPLHKLNRAPGAAQPPVARSSGASRLPCPLQALGEGATRACAQYTGRGTYAGA
ncbi:hypothetical protein PG993_004139 [Apiospora rasikravindrae]|uniref:Uncharacterized protein n=1 Tax=Apiospora rasikravindrae TaxID=990691 RepID=A0ABR1TBX7_9PEZI